MQRPAIGVVDRGIDRHQVDSRAEGRLALNDSGTPMFDEQLAKKLAALGIPCFACTPQRLPELLEGALRGANLIALAERITQAAKAK